MVDAVVMDIRAILVFFFHYIISIYLFCVYVCSRIIKIRLNDSLSNVGFKGLIISEKSSIENFTDIFLFCFFIF